MTTSATAGFRDCPSDPVARTAVLVAAKRAKESARDDRCARVDALSAPGSVLLDAVVGKTLREAPFIAALRQSMAEQGSPWLFGTDAPGALVEDRGWSSSVTNVAEPGHRWGRWHAPAVPPDVTAIPRGYFVEAHKRPRTPP